MANDDFALIPESKVRREIAGVSQGTWHRMRKEGTTPSPAIRLRGRRYYKPSVIENWLKIHEQMNDNRAA
jgi:hypothetical protein